MFCDLKQDMIEMKTFLVVIAQKYNSNQLVEWFCSTEENKIERIRNILQERNIPAEDVNYVQAFEIKSNEMIDPQDLL